MKVAFYARVSRHDKDQNPQNQVVKLKEFAQRHSWEVVKEYTDVASGAKASRPGLDDMLRDARAGHFKAILAVRIDRIGRSVVNLKNILEDLRHDKVDLICTDQDIDTSSSSGKFFFTILAAVAEFELDLIRDRTLDGLSRARAQGKRLGRPRYPVLTDDILRLREEGLTLRQIAEKVGMSRAGVKKRLRLARIQNGVEIGI